MGPGASVEVGPGDRSSKGDWEIKAVKPVFERRVHASLEVEKREGPLRLVATMTARDYANGILKAELGTAPGPLRAQLAAAVLRYAARGARHAEADVCDSTHCAWFVGEVRCRAGSGRTPPATRRRSRRTSPTRSGRGR